MKTGYFIVPVDQDGNLKLDESLKKKLQLNSGDKVEITIKKISSKKGIPNPLENPLYELIK